MATKIGRGDYFPDIYPCAKLHFDPIRVFCPPHMRSCLSNVHSASFYFFCGGVLPTRYRLGRCADFDDQYAKRRRFAHSDTAFDRSKIALFATHLESNAPTEKFPWDDLRKILYGGQKIAKVHNGEEILPKASTPE